VGPAHTYASPSSLELGEAKDGIIISIRIIIILLLAIFLTLKG
jgi:hypothetical protein